MSKCPNSWTGSHRYEPRFDSRLPNMRAFEADYVGPALIEAMKTRTYIRDVCVRCGSTIEREPANRPAACEGGGDGE